MSLCWMDLAGRSFPSSNKPLFQSKAKYKAIDIRMIFFYSHANRIPLHKKGLAVSLILKVIVFAEAYHPNCSRHCDVTCGMWSHIFIVFCNACSRLDSSDWEKCFIKHRSLHLLTPNVNNGTCKKDEKITYYYVFRVIFYLLEVFRVLLPKTNT